jgi:hypothetical protein
MALVQFSPIAVADHVVRHPARAVAEYLKQHGGTVTHYDFQAANFSQINLDLTRATRSPWMGSRISAAQAAWIIDRGTTAPWDTIPLDAQLKDADPLTVNGLYDRATVLWEHFWETRPANVSTAKISKVLYLIRPGLFPILDSYLTRFYRKAAQTAAIDVGQRRIALSRYNRLYWEAIRRDILANEPGLRILRQTLASAGAPLAEQASQKLSDLRILDILAWAASEQSITRKAPVRNADVSPTRHTSNGTPALNLNRSGALWLAY